MLLMESNKKKWKLEETKKKKWFTDRKCLAMKLTQIDSVKRDMQFSVRQQLQQMEILEGRKPKMWLIKTGNDFLCKTIYIFTVTKQASDRKS